MSFFNPILLDDMSIEAEQVKKILLDVFGNSSIAIESSTDNFIAALTDQKSHGLCVICCKDELQGLSLILNRIKSNQDLSFLPILLIAGRENIDSFKLLSEFPCTQWITRPASLLQISKSLTLLSQEIDWYRGHISAIEKTLEQLKQSEEELEILLEASPQSGIPLAFLYSELALKNNAPELAEKALRWIIKKDPNNLRAIAGLGRALFILNRRQEAGAYLRIARRVSKSNVERLCMLGEIAIGDGKYRAAKKNFIEAKKIDHEEKRAIAGLDVISNIGNILAQKAGKGLALSLVQTYNIVAISHVNEKKMSSAVDIYHGALKIAHDPIVKARVEFNLGLCYLKWGKKKEAIDWFSLSLQSSKGRFIRGRDYLEKLQEKPETAQEFGWTELVPEVTMPKPKTLVFDETDFQEESL